MLLKDVEKSYDPGVKVLDVDYFLAEEAGDMETAQRMIDDAASLAMPNTKVVDENGKEMGRTGITSIGTLPLLSEVRNAYP